MTGVIRKTTTALTGLKVARNPVYTLTILYGKINKALQKMPQDAAYRKYTEEIINQRAKIVKNTSNLQEIEKQINCGQAEELIIQAENELLLARKFLEYKPWEPLENKPPADQWQWPPA